MLRTEKELLYKMKRIRMAEEYIGKKFQEQKMRTPMHLSIGQEAIAVGMCHFLNNDDIIYSNHRGHGHYLAKGGDLKALMSELYNRRTGCSQGRGGSMHIIDKKAGVGLTSSIVAGNVPIATGHALSFKMKKNNNVSIAFFGDGASEEGCVYESVCYAAVAKLPIIYVCENNLYAMYTTLDKREPASDIVSKFKGILPTVLADGNNITEVCEIAKTAIANTRNGKGPIFIEFNTYRLANHYEVKGGNSLGYRSEDEYQYWEDHNPVLLYEKLLLERRIITQEEINIMERNIFDELEKANEYAINSEYPDPKTVSEGVFA